MFKRTLQKNAYIKAKFSPNKPIIFPYVVWTIPVGIGDNDCSVLPTETCSNDEMNDYIRPIQQHSLGVPLHHVYFPPDSEGKRLKEIDKKTKKNK